MKSLFIIASVLALAVASPAHRGLVLPGPAGPAFVENESVVAGPTFVDYENVVAGPAFVDPIEESVPAPATPTIQLIININGAQVEVAPPSAILPPVVDVVAAPEPVEVPGIPEVIDIGVPVMPELPTPVEIGAPALPNPAVVLPDDLN